jgi:hypothetical protein
LGDVAGYIRVKMATAHMTSEARRQLLLAGTDQSDSDGAGV